MSSWFELQLLTEYLPARILRFPPFSIQKLLFYSVFIFIPWLIQREKKLEDSLIFVRAFVRGWGGKLDWHMANKGVHCFKKWSSIPLHVQGFFRLAEEVSHIMTFLSVGTYPRLTINQFTTSLENISAYTMNMNTHLRSVCQNSYYERTVNRKREGRGK